MICKKCGIEEMECYCPQWSPEALKAVGEQLTTDAVRKAIKIALEASIKPVRKLIGRKAYGREFYFIYARRHDQTLPARIRKHANRRPTSAQ